MSNNLLGCNSLQFTNANMHAFPELIDRCTAFTLQALEEAQGRTIESLQTSGATTLVKTLQMVQLQKVVSAVGMFSIFDALLQDRLECTDGFKEADAILDCAGAVRLKEHFGLLKLAINVLKHGEGRSYNELLGKAALPFNMKKPGEDFFDEGDVSEVQTLIEVDDAFVINCSTTIRAVTEVIQKARPEFIA